MSNINLLCLSLIVFSLIVLCLCAHLYHRISEIHSEISRHECRIDNIINDIDTLYQEVNKSLGRYDTYTKLFTETRTEFNKIKMMLLTLKDKE